MCMCVWSVNSACHVDAVRTHPGARKFCSSAFTMHSSVHMASRLFPTQPEILLPDISSDPLRPLRTKHIVLSVRLEKMTAVVIPDHGSRSYQRLSCSYTRAPQWSVTACCCLSSNKSQLLHGPADVQTRPTLARRKPASWSQASRSQAHSQWHEHTSPAPRTHGREAVSTM